MKTKKEISTFPDEVKMSIFTAQNGYCKDCLEKIHSFHHKLKNCQENRRKFPLLINSAINCVGLCLNHHTNFDYLYMITEQEAAVYESFLEEIAK